MVASADVLINYSCHRFAYRLGLEVQSGGLRFGTSTVYDGCADAGNAQDNEECESALNRLFSGCFVDATCGRATGFCNVCISSIIVQVLFGLPGSRMQEFRMPCTDRCNFFAEHGHVGRAPCHRTGIRLPKRRRGTSC